MRLLIVDDNPGVRRLIRILVGGVTREVRECSDGADALEAYQLERPDFVLMDIQMGALDGIATTRRIVAADPRARVIIVTDHDQPDLREAAREAGACGFVAKENLLELLPLLRAKDAG
jgi:CheY-like chemotaxis protein